MKRNSTDDEATNWSEVRAALLHALRIVEMHELAQPARPGQRKSKGKTRRR
jgi:hypothetical protein